MKTILFACHNYKGYNGLVKPLVSFFEKKDIEIVFIHINSIEENYEVDAYPKYRHFDLSLTKPRAFIDFINKEKPIALICLEFTSLFIILLARIAKFKKIKTIYLEHGIFIEGHGDKFLIKSVKKSIKRYSRILRIYLSIIVILKLRAFSELLTLHRTFIKRDYSGLFDFGLFFAPRGYNILKDKLSLPINKAYFAGYPLVSYTEEINELLIKYEKESNNVLYIHQPLIQDKLTEISYNEEIDFFYQINRICKEKSLNLIIKIHPRESLKNYQELDKNGVLQFTSLTFGNILPTTRIIIGQFSTALFNGLILNIPIILLPYPNLKQFYYKDFTIFSYLSESVEQLSQIIDLVMNDVREIPNTDQIKKELIGEINSYENQANKILDILKIDKPSI